jgi:hypothetical protein
MARFGLTISLGLRFSFLAVLAGITDFAHGHSGHRSQVVLTPSIEEVRKQVNGGYWESSYNEDKLEYSSKNPETKSYVTFDLSKADFFDDYNENRKHFVDAKLKLYSLDNIPDGARFDAVLMEQNERDNKIDNSQIDYSDCTNSRNNCWIELDVTKELLWSVEEQRDRNDWNPRDGYFLTVRITVPSRQNSVSGKFAAKEYDSRFSPELDLDFTDDGDLEYYSSSLKKEKNKSKNIRGSNNSKKKKRKHKVKVVKGKRKKNKRDNKSRNKRGRSKTV